MISLAIIAKDEVKKLDKCIGSVYDFVDEVVLVVNKPAVKGFAGLVKKYPKINLFERKWNDNFADARNYSFDKCKYDTILWLDSDDTVEKPEQLRKLDEIITDKKADWISVEYIYATDDQGRVTMRQWKPRVMRKGSGKWVGAVHETFIADRAVGQIIDEDLKIIHHNDAVHGRASGLRNLAILAKEFDRDGEKTDPRTTYYLANTLMGLGRQKEAIPFYQIHIAKCGWPEEKYFSLHYLSQCLRFVGRTEEAINASLEATKLFPHWSLAYFDLGEHYGVQGKWRACIEWTKTGFEKEKPAPIDYFISDVDYNVNPYARLVYGYLATHQFKKAYVIAEKLYKRWPKDKALKELFDDCKKIMETENFIEAFIKVAKTIRDKDRSKAVKLFDALPVGMDNDIRLQTLRQNIVPPKVWEDKSVVIYCHPGHEEWAYPSLFSGIGGSEEMVIRMSLELTKLGYKVTIYNKCGSLEGEYMGVTYKPHYHFNSQDQFDTVIIWRYAGFMADRLNAKRKYVWLHDIVHSTIFNDKIIENTNKFLFLSKWHRNNVPELPEEKVYITGNAIEPREFEGVPVKRPNSLVWTSSYDRGVLCLARDILPLIEKEIPDVTLDIAYGMANIEKEMDSNPYLREVYDGMQEVFKKPNVTHHGRISHKKVVELQKSSLVHAYSSEFGETFNISSVKAQCSGCYVITMSQAGATPEYIRFGKVIEGNGIYSNKKLQRQYADEVIKFLKNPIVLSEEDRWKIIEEFSVAKLAKTWHENLLNG